MKKIITLCIIACMYVPAIFPQSLEILGHSNDFEQMFELYKQTAYEKNEIYNYFYSELEQKFLPGINEDEKKIIGKDTFFISWLASDELDINILSLCNIETQKSMFFYFRTEMFDNFLYCTKYSIDFSLMQIYLLWAQNKKDGVLFNFNLLDAAIEKSNKALKNNPDDYQSLLERGNAYRDKDEFDQALADYNSALKIKPDFPEALTSRGYVYYFKDEFDKAIEDYTAALKIKPDDTYALYNRGITYEYLREWDKAIADYTAVLKVNPKDYETMTNRGVVYGKKGDNNRALADFTASIKIKPDYYRAFHCRGLGYMNMNNYNKAIADFQAALKIAPDDADIQQALENARQKRKR